MQIKDIKKALPHLLDSDLTPILTGHSGLGKTESIKQFAEENGYFLKIVNLAMLSDSGDLLGLPTFKKDSMNNEIATAFITPDWVKEILDYANENPQSRAIIYLDEINRARRDILQAVFSLALEKRIHMIQFPSNVGIIAANNPATSEYVVTDISDSAFMKRFVHIKVTPSVDEWLDYAKKTKHDDTIVSFLSTQRELLDGTTEDFNLDDVKPSRRSWSAVDRLLKTNPPEELVRELMFGLVGAAATIAYEEHAKTIEKPLSAEDILTSFDKNLPKILGYIKDNRIDLLEKSGKDVAEYLGAFKGILDDGRFNNLVKLIEVMPPEVTFSFCQVIAQHQSVFKLMMDSKAIINRIKLIRGK